MVNFDKPYPELRIGVTARAKIVGKKRFTLQGELCLGE